MSLQLLKPLRKKASYKGNLMILKDTDIGRLILDKISIEKTAKSNKTSELDVSEAVMVSEGLTKAASLPYKEEAYGSVQEIMKIASEAINELVKSFESSQGRVSDLEKAAEVRSLVDDMIKIGSIDEYNIDDKVTELMLKTSEQLAITKEAMKLIGESRKGNVFGEEEKTAGASRSPEKGMFDDVIE